MFLSKSFWCFFSALICLSCTQTVKTYTHDVGYIDPETALGPKNFKTCDTTVFFQYYNEFPRAGYKHGKNKLREIIARSFKRVSEDNGYLTYRFVINCHGAAGRFNIIENDLALSANHFDEKLKQQLLSIILNDLTEWNPLYFEGTARDSYIYLMFRIEDGEIIDILP
jgi:hypothetical protein